MSKSSFAKSFIRYLRHESSIKVPVFRLSSWHLPIAAISDSHPPLPSDFHSYLCQRIRNARDRVLLVSLYIGAAASSTPVPEQELLNALSDSAEGVNVQILMDGNRATRPLQHAGKKTTTSSAQAVLEALQKREGRSSPSSLHLFPTLSPWKQRVLVSPINEVESVTHLKAYIVDDELILSGANLSGEYFIDRQDRYFHVANGGNGLVDWYADLIELLISTAGTPMQRREREHQSKQPRTESILPDLSMTSEKLQRLETALIKKSQDSEEAQIIDDDEDVVAYAVPTIEFPLLRHLSTDWPLTKGVLDFAASQSSSPSTSQPQTDYNIRLASAYLNPTPEMLESLRQFHSVEVLTAGPKSHGFAPKPGVKRKGDFVPKIFTSIASKLRNEEPHLHLDWYQREGWTFHAKGLWVMEDKLPQQSSTTKHTDKSKEAAILRAAMVGSGNYGYRSYQRDIESNLLLVFPHSSSPLQNSLLREWDNMKQWATSPSDEQLQQIPIWVRVTSSLIRGYF